MSKVYFTKDLSQEGLIKIYQALNPNIRRKNRSKNSFW